VCIAENGKQLAEIVIQEMHSSESLRLPLLYLCGNIRRDELPDLLKTVSGVGHKKITTLSPIHVLDSGKNSGQWIGSLWDGYWSHTTQWLVILYHWPKQQKEGKNEQHGRFNATDQFLLSKVDWMCFFSPSGVTAVAEELRKHNSEAPQGHLCKIAAIGPTTATALSRAFSQPPDAIAASPCASSLFDAITSVEQEGGLKIQ